MEYYSAIKRNEIGSFVETWMDLKSIIQSDISQKEKNKYRILMQGRSRDTDVENKRMDTKGGKWGGGGVCQMSWEIGIDVYTLICIK